MRGANAKEPEPFEEHNKETLIISSEGGTNDFAERLLQEPEDSVVVEPEERGIFTGIALLLFFVIDTLLRAIGLY